MLGAPKEKGAETAPFSSGMDAQFTCRNPAGT
jgi:hypothetical protein